MGKGSKRSSRVKSRAINVGGKTRNVQIGSAAEKKYLAQGGTVGTEADKAARSTYLKSLNTPGSANYRDESALMDRDIANGGKTLPNGMPGPINQEEKDLQKLADVNPELADQKMDELGYDKTLAGATREDVLADLKSRGIQANDQTILGATQRLNDASGFKRFQGGYEQLKDTPVDTSLGGAMSRINQVLPSDAAQKPDTTPMVDDFFNTDPTVQQSTQDIMDWLSPPSVRKELSKQMKSIIGAQDAILEDKLDLMNVERLMDGSEQDIRDEVTAAQGFATDSQVRALAIARNKTLLAEASFIQDQISIQEQAVANKISLLNYEKDMANTQFQQRSWALNYQQQNNQFMYNAYKDTVNTQIQALGWDGVWDAYSKDPAQLAKLSKMTGMSSVAIEKAARLAADQRARDIAQQQAAINASNRSGLSSVPSDQLYSGLSPQTATAVRTKVSKFSTEPMVQNFATIQDGYLFTNSLAANTTNPADDQALIYSLAKALDPGSVVREGEYATAQKYAQSWIKSYGKGVEQALTGTGFLSQDARRNIKQTIENRYKSAERTYNNLYSQYTQGINSLTGRTDGNAFLIDYTVPTVTGGQDIDEQPTQNDVAVFDEVVGTQSGWWDTLKHTIGIGPWRL